MFNGVYTALVTPFQNGQIDFQSLEKLIKDQLDNGIEGFVVCGTTAESPTLSEEESLKILDFVCEKTNGAVPIIFGSGSNSTQKTIELSQKASTRPIAGFLVVVPYYNKPPQEGLIAHFTAVADAVNKPVVLYNVPGRTITALSGPSLIELSKHPNIVGVKEASGDLNFLKEFAPQTGKDFCWLSGDDETSVDFCLLGGDGVISVCSHIGPEQMVSWIKRGREKDESVRADFEPHKEWIRQLYCTSNPIPVKSALQVKGVIASDEMRLPLVPLAKSLKDPMVSTLRKFSGVLS